MLENVLCSSVTACRKSSWVFITIGHTVRLIAGSFILLSLALGHYVSPYWYIFTAFVGLNLLQSGFTNWCPMMTFLRKLGVGR